MGSTARGNTELLAGYFSNDLYSASGRLNFDAYLLSFQEAGIKPIALLETDKRMFAQLFLLRNQLRTFWLFLSAVR